jgi:hypothetical protein
VKIGVYIVHKLDSLLFHTTQLKLRSLYTINYFLTPWTRQIGIGFNFTLTLLSVFGDLDFELSCEKSHFSNKKLIKIPYEVICKLLSYIRSKHFSHVTYNI